MRDYERHDFPLLDSCCSYKYPTVIHVKYFGSKDDWRDQTVCN